MAKKNKTQTATASAAAADDSTEKTASESTPATASTNSTPTSAANTLSTKEETKVDSSAAAPMRRRNSRINMQRDADDTDDNKLYRPEFGTASANKDGTQAKLWDLMSSYQGTDQRSIQRSIVNHVEYTLARTRFNFDNFGAYQASAYSLRDRLIEGWNDAQEYHTVSQHSAFFCSQQQLLKHLNFLSLLKMICRFLTLCLL